jgi:ribonuclease P protein component
MQRLKRRADFLAAAHGARVSLPVFTMQARDRRDRAAPRIGFTVSRKTGNAVERNRIRRRLREAARTVVTTAGHAGFDYVLVARRPALDAPFPTLLSALEQAVERVHRSARAARAPRDGGADG